MSTFEPDAADAALRGLVPHRIEALERTVQLLDYDKRIELTRWINEGWRLLDADAPKARAHPFLRALPTWGRDPEAA